MHQNRRPLVLLAAGGTGGHLFPAEALAQVLAARGIDVDLITDARGGRYGEEFPASAVHVVASETIRSHNPVSLVRTAALLSLGSLQSWRLIGRRRPVAVVGFGGYPSLPPVVAAALRRVPAVIHEQNAVMGRANRLLAPHVTAIAVAFDALVEREPRLAGKMTRTGNPVRPPVIAAADIPYVAPESGGSFRLLVFGGSQGARVMANVVPSGLAQLDPALRARLSVVQQARPEDAARVAEAYQRGGIAAEVAPFFADLPARMASAHLVVARSGASTVAELAAIGRPAILVPLPHALDQDQAANATVLERAGAALRIAQDGFTPARLSAEVAALASAPQKLVAMAAASRAVGALDAAERLADLVMGTMRRGH